MNQPQKNQIRLYLVRSRRDPHEKMVFATNSQNALLSHNPPSYLQDLTETNREPTQIIPEGHVVFAIPIDDDFTRTSSTRGVVERVKTIPSERYLELRRTYDKKRDTYDYAVATLKRSYAEKMAQLEKERAAEIKKVTSSHD